MGWGLLQGLGQGLNQVGSSMMQNYFEKEREERLRSYQQGLVEQANAREDRIRAEENTREDTIRDAQNTLVDTRHQAEVDRENAAAVARTEYETVGDKRFEVSYNAENQEIKRIEVIADPVRQFYGTGENVYNAFDGTLLGGTSSDADGGPGYSAEQVEAANKTISDFLDSEDMLTDQQRRMLDGALQIRSEMMGIDFEPAGASQEDITWAREEANKQVQSMAGWLSGDQKDFAEFGGDRNAARDHYFNFYLSQRLGDQGASSEASSSEETPSRSEPPPPGMPPGAQRGTDGKWYVRINGQWNLVEVDR